MATIWDADILFWASTQITEALDRGLKPANTDSVYSPRSARASRP